MSKDRYHTNPGDSNEAQMLTIIANEIRNGFKNVNESMIKISEYVEKASNSLNKIEKKIESPNI